MMALFRVGPLPEEALAASARFHAEVLPNIHIALQAARCLILLFGPADHTHRDWRQAAVRQLARLHVPARINAVESDDEDAIAATLRYLEAAEGVTGQLHQLDGRGAGDVLSSS